MSFYCIVYQVSHKWSYPSTDSYIRVFTVLATRCHTKGPTNLQSLIYGVLVYCLPGVTQKVLPIYSFLYTGFQCIVLKVSHKRSYQSTGSYIRVFSVLSTRSHTKGPTNLQVLIYGSFTALCSRCDTKGPANLQILIYGFLMYCLPGVTQKVLPSYMFLYTGFLCIVYQVSHKRSYQSTGSYVWVFAYCLSGVTQKVLQIYRFLYMYFQCISYQVSHKRS